MKIAVFGSTGFMGSHLVARLLREGHHVRSYSKGNAPNAMPGMARIQHQSVDLRLVDDYRSMVEDCDAVFQLMSTSVPSTSHADPYRDVSENLLPTLRILEAMKACDVPKIIFPSSGGTVYGEPQYLPMDETHPTHPKVSYGATKLAIENFLLITHQIYDVKSIILRITNPYGPGFRISSPQGAIGHFLNRAIKNEPIILWGNGNTVRDYIYIDDVVEAFFAALSYQGTHNIFNISTGIGSSLLDVLTVIEAELGRPLQIEHRDSRSFDVSSNILSNALAREQLSWTPFISLSAGISRTVDWLKNQAKIA